MHIQRLSILIPCYNEEQMVGDVLKMVTNAEMMFQVQKEIIVIDDGSSDNTPACIQQFIQDNPGQSIKLITHQTNRGKGACVRSGLASATGEVIIIQDADLEYDPSEYNKLLMPIA